MKLPPFLRIAPALIAAGLGACASPPPSNAALDDARASYARAAADPAVMRSAPVELRKAQTALQQATDAQKKGAERSEVDHYAYLASKQTEIAMTARSIAESDEAVTAAAQRRDAIVIESRTRDADTQRRIAELARMDAEQQRRQTELARSVANSNAVAAESAEAKARSLAEQLAELKARQTNRGMVLTLGDVLFDTGLATLSAGASGPIDHLATFLKNNPGRTATIEGYTDSSGGNGMNQALSERRAEAVKNALIDRGVTANRITARGFGEVQLVATNDTASGRQQNRRVEIVLANAG